MVTTGGKGPEELRALSEWGYILQHSKLQFEGD